ncbi:YALI0C19712p [Yarrowia lipolytica CLIB122]|jgi:Golgi apyrase|uniref:YALI0C19712p n=2 Tax=Yarrowia lipolytica TaxID=4952 RepID=Q6CBD9_YARLI|nr:YALI0C19712p [Yarrowia lipolytica CLIB122]AOW03105.1 hypothetical protein YALI1_C27061g [Yarrowia lipolytica]AOW03129.1 hypothetical protein YALI1_C27665g [Yarrowia lipolytica]KAB8279938.1 nucleoside phosphatase family-domain-containing protein [Yarrowia lipolytica]KAE8168911.1 nucleoside phosphatase family-domain-containing protein [Yarrowia lipolytica]KAJ8053638.1 nucleoside phosphatase family-domain-containing protein [Yarrowia lipolytica]|eukprot:XP_502023.1 YALI0C19712p [Yarrowia lipolytica CLIB122]
MAPSKRRYGVVVDAGSSGSRVFIYSWEDALLQQKNLGQLSLLEQNSVTKLHSEKEWKKKIFPGVSSFAGRSRDELWSEHVKPLVDHVMDHVPKSAIPSTPIFFLATAGMRLLDEPVREHLLNTVCELLATNTGFYLGAGGCAKRPNVEIIDGEVEGLYGWLGLNYLAGSLVSKVEGLKSRDLRLPLGESQDLASLQSRDELADVKNPHDESRLSESSTLGFMDMGGASAQIAFVPNATETARHLDDLYQVRLRSVNGQLQEWNVFVSTWLGFGANEARRRYLETLPAVEGIISDPCLMKGLTMNYGDFKVIGGGDFSACMANASPLLMKHLPCTDHPCLFNGVHAPALDFSMTKFIGISEYWYTSADIFGLREEDYNFHVFSHKTQEYCSRDWDDIVAESEEGGFNKISRDKLQVACFKATWVLTILHEGFGVPIGPMIGEESEDPTDTPFVSPFKSLETFDDQELSWTLGKMVLYSSSQVPPAKNSDDREVGVGYVPSMLDGSTIVIPGGEGRTSEDIGFLSLPLVFLLVIAFGVVYFLLGKTKVTGGIINQFSRLTQRLRWKKTLESVDLESGPVVPPTCRSSSALDLSEMRSNTPRLQTSQSSINIPTTGRFKGLGMNSRAPSRSSSATRLAE